MFFFVFLENELAERFDKFDASIDRLKLFVSRRCHSSCSIFNVGWFSVLIPNIVSKYIFLCTIPRFGIKIKSVKIEI